MQISNAMRLLGRCWIQSLIDAIYIPTAMPDDIYSSDLADLLVVPFPDMGLYDNL